MPTPTTPWDRLFNDIKISVPGLTDAVLKQELYRVVTDFFDQTNVWDETIPFNVVPNTLNYQVTPAGKGAANRLLLVYDPANAGPDKRWVQGGIQFQMPDVIQLATSPSTATTWNAIISKQLDDPVTREGYPDIDPNFFWVLNKYRDALTYGTLARVFIQPAKTYSNLKLAQFNNANYVSERSQARVDVLHSHTYGGQRWMFPQGYATTARKGWT